MSSRTKNATQASASKSRANTSRSSTQKQKQPQQVFDIDDDDDDDKERDELATSQPAVASTSSKTASSKKPAASTTRNTATRSPTPELPPPLNQTAATNGHDGEDDELLDENGYDEDGAPEGLLPTATIRPDEEREEDCIKILLATDNHIGYGERDPVRGRDSIETFKEILQLAQQNDVDMLLLAGDLFHENKPSRSSLHQTMALLREHCMGPRPISLEIVSDVGVGLQTGYNFPPINYEDPNYNIGLPVFSIHGNHDDPQGAGPEGALCALDILSASGLVTYFGRQELPGEASTDEEALASGIQVKPVLLKKGNTKLAMFGVGNIRDERFHAEMRKNRISMFRPAENPHEWFNLLLIHQNRAPRGPKNSVPENGFGDEVDLIVWGHEHDCRIDPEPVTGKNYYISQPGSSVATSLAAGEAVPKHVGLLKIQGRKFDMQKLRLRTVRPFVMDDIVLSDVAEIEGVSLENKVQVNKYLKTRVNELITRVNEEWEQLYEGDEDRPPMMLPLIRIRVEYTGYEVGNPQRFGQDFTDKVANPRDIVQFFKKKVINRNGKKITIDEPEGLDPRNFAGELPEKIEKIKVETLVRQYLEAQTLQMLHENGIAYAVNAFVEKDDKHAIESFITKTLKQQQDTIAKGDRDEHADTDEEIEKGMVETKDKLAQAFEEKNAKKSVKGKGKAAEEEEEEEEEQEEEGSDFDKMSVDESDGPKSKAKGKGKAATGKAAASSKGKKKEQLFNDDSDDNDSEEVAPKNKAPAKKAAATSKTSATAKKTAASSKQSQLSFGSASSSRYAPSKSTSTRTAAKASTSKSKKQVEDDSDDDDEVANAIELDDSSDDEPAKKRATKKR